MEQEEELRRLIDRGKLRVSERTRGAIATAMHPLPPPWEWQSLREAAGLTIVDMGQASRLEYGRIRRWEHGGGTTDPRLWLEYGRLLVDAVISELRSRGDHESLARGEDGTVSVRLSPGVQRQVEMLHSTAISLGMWAEGDGRTSVCSPTEAAAMDIALRETQLVMRKVREQLRIVRTRTGTGELQ